MMKSFYFLSLIVSVLTITTDSYGMLTALLKRKNIYSPAQRNYCRKQSSVQQRIKYLEILVTQQRLELETLKKDINKLNNNNQKPDRWRDDFLDRDFVDGSYCEKYNMHVPVREKN